MFTSIPNVGGDSGGGGSERRKSGRLNCAGTTCQFGPIVDLSKSGLKVVSKKAITLPPGATVNLRIETIAGSMLVPGKPVMCRKRPDGKFDVGFEFQFTDEDMVRRLVALAHAAADCHEYKPHAA